MTIEEVKKATIDDAKVLVSLANQHDIDVTVYDLDADADILADIISNQMKDSGIEMVYNFIKDAAEGRSPFAVINNYGLLEPFEEADLADLKERLCEKVFPARDSEILEDIEVAARQEYSIEGVYILDCIGDSFGISTQFGDVSVASESQAVIDEFARRFRESGPVHASAFMENISSCAEDALIIESDPPEIYTEDDFCSDRDDLVAELRNRLTDIDV